MVGAAAEVLFPLAHRMFSTTTSHPSGALAPAQVWLSEGPGGGRCSSLSMSSFAEEQHFKGWFRLTAMWKLESSWWWEGSAAHSRLNLDPALAIPNPSDFNQRIESVQLQTWRENGVTNVGQLPMHHGTGNLAEQPFFIYSYLNVVRIFRKCMHPDSCCCVIKGSVRHGKWTEHCPVVWSLTINRIYTFSCHCWFFTQINCLFFFLYGRVKFC